MPPYRWTLTAAVTEGSQLSEQASREAGFDEYLVKPITRERLAQVLEHVLTARRSAPAATRPPRFLVTSDEVSSAEWP
jgi:CheY-like chemotaxis protein